MDHGYWRDNLKRIFESSGLTQQELKKCGVSQSQISLLINGKRPFTQKTLELILNGLNITYHDLFAKPIVCDSERPLSITVVSKYHKDILNGSADDYRGIPLYESGKLAAGPNGAQFDPYETPKSIVVVYRPELKGCSHHNMAAVKVGGDSMEPTIPMGAIVVIDLDDKEYFNGKIYAVNTPDGGIDMVSIKRVQKFKTGFLLVSDNHKHNHTPSELDWYCLCVGRIVWMWKDVREA